MNRGYIKLWRKIFDSGIQKEPATFTLWIWILCNVTRQPLKYIARGQQINLEPGELIVGRKRLSEELMISEQSIRTCLEHLKSWGNLTIRSTNRFSILKVINWELYQEQGTHINQQINQEVTSNQPASNHKTRSKEEKNKYIDPQVYEIISYLNQSAGKNFHFNGANARFVSARLKDGATVEQCKAVIDSKVKEWIGTDYEKYIRPETLFNERKFEGYVNSISKSTICPSEKTSHVPIN